MKTVTDKHVLRFENRLVAGNNLNFVLPQYDLSNDTEMSEIGVVQLNSVPR